MSLELRPGELLAVVGENGAGKSSLMNVLHGLYRPDSGEVRFDGRAVRLRTPADAMARGIGMVHQHFMLVPGLTVAENVVLGVEPTRRGLLDVREAQAQVAATCRRFGFELDPSVPVERLGVGQQQKVEIVRALHREARTLILDEPTAVLTPQEAEDLYRVARELAAAGTTVVFITHRLREVMEVAHRVAVMRRGRLVAEAATAQTSIAELASLMMGTSRDDPHADALAEFQASQATHASPTVARPKAEVTSDDAAPTGADAPLLELREVSVIEGGRAVLTHLNLELRAGDIVGIAGVDGNGQSELAEVVTGLRSFTHGELRVGGEALVTPSPAALRARGVAHIPEDRHRRAVVGAMSVEENLALGRQRTAPFARSGRIDFSGRSTRARKLVADFDVRPGDPALPMAALSGGNQQKAVLARELDLNPRVMVAVQPTRGLDFGSVAALHDRLRKVAQRGAAVLLISLDLDEVLALSHRIHVLHAGRITGTQVRGAFDPQVLGRLMMGAEAHA
ncbi:MAG TPA: ABC transporter ATP-binding protein [Myxococcaceae bacterium]|nr:ABC transporter ATP-binding protein [Myxococcaceae bacterium]